MLCMQLQFLFELPARLKKCIEMKSYGQAVKLACVCVCVFVCVSVCMCFLQLPFIWKFIYCDMSM